MLHVLAAAALADPLTHGVIMKIDAYGTPLVGHVVVDADALAAVGLTFSVEGEPRTGPSVPLAHGTFIKGLPKGDRYVEDAIATLMYFDGNGDGYLDGKDPVFAHLALFVDANADGATQAGEVRKFGDIGIDAISRFGSVIMKERSSK